MLAKIRNLVRSALSRTAGHEPQRYVFVVTYGRSGSTLLMKLINSMPGFDIKGENNGAIQHLIESVHRLQVGQERYGSRGTSGIEDPWYGIDDVWAAGHARQIRAMIARRFLRVLPGKSVGGFKEIRAFQLSDMEFAFHVDFLLGYPDARIVFLTRETAQVMQSAWWKDRDPAEVEQLIARMDRLFARAHQQHPQQTALVDYADLQKYADYTRLAQFLHGSLSEAQHAEILGKRINQASTA